MRLFSFLRWFKRKPKEVAEEPVEETPEGSEVETTPSGFTKQTCCRDETNRPSVKHVCFNKAKVVTRRVKRLERRTDYYHDNGDLLY